MESVQPPPAGSQTSRVPSQRTRPGQPDPDPVPVPVPEQRTRRLRLSLAVVGGVLALLCLGGGAIAFVLYDNATKPDRSAPDVVVDNYLRALLVDRDEAQAEQYVCSTAPRLNSMIELRDDLRRRESEFNSQIGVSWSKMSVSDDVESSRVLVDIRLSASIDGFRQSEKQSWEFGVVKSGEWSVCGARRIS